MSYKLLRGEAVFCEFEDVRTETIETEELEYYGILHLDGCVLKMPVGEFEVGDLIPHIRIDLSPGGTIQMFDEERLILSEYEYTCILYSLGHSDYGNIIVVAGEPKEVLQQVG